MCANLGRYAFISLLMRSVLSQGSAQLTFSSNLVYTGEPVTLTVAYGSGLQLLHVVLDAFNGTLQKGFLYCKVSPVNTTGLGVFDGKSFYGCPTIPAGANSVSVTLTAAPSLELNYTCTARVTDSSQFYNLTCDSGFMAVRDCPLPPSFQISPIVFNDSGVIVCGSRNGKPAANVSLMVTSISGARLGPEYSSDVAYLNLTWPLSDWHNATASCRVTNHNCSNMNVKINPDMQVTSTVMINHIINTSIPDVVCTNESTVVLNCATYIRSYPGVLYKWTVPPEANGTSSLADLSSLTVLQGQSGLYNCTATNNLTAASVVIVFSVSNTCRANAMTTSLPDPDVCPKCWIIGLAFGIIILVIIAVVLGVLGKRGHFSKGKKKHVVPNDNDNRSANGSRRVRLLIAAEGVVSQLSVRALHTTDIVEYSDCSCSLNDIIEKVTQAVARSPTKFKSVALLLRPAKVGVTLSEVDQVVLNSSSIQDEKGEKLRFFMTRLAKTCLDERGDTRMDILNYNGKAPLRLSEVLTKFLGIPTTVSKDQFGVETPTDEKGGHAVVADTYFDRNKLDIIYAEIQLPSVKPQVQPRPAEEGVTYAEIRR